MRTISQQQAETFALMLDTAECELVRIQRNLWQIRQALQRIVGHPVGYQYTEPNERGLVAEEPR